MDGHEHGSWLEMASITLRTVGDRLRDVGLRLRQLAGAQD
jgi:hypothetical protein